MTEECGASLIGKYEAVVGHRVGMAVEIYVGDTLKKRNHWLLDIGDNVVRPSDICTSLRQDQKYKFRIGVTGYVGYCRVEFLGYAFDVALIYEA